MCGIGGIRRYGNKPIDRDSVESMLVGLQVRGNDATGIAVVNPAKAEHPGVHVYKTDDPAWQTVESAEFKKWMDAFFLPETTIVLLHTRAATQGNPRINDNNHPMYKDDVAVVHNGVIRNDEALFKDMKLSRNAETDSDLLRAILDKEGLTKAGIRSVARIEGSVACAAVSQSDPDRLLLVRSGSPLVCAELEDFFIWASEKTIIHSAFKPFTKKWGLEFQKSTIPGIGWLNMADDSAWIMGAKGLEWHDSCRTCVSYSEPRRHVFTNYKERNQKWDDDAKRTQLTLPVAGKSANVQVRIRCRKCKNLNKLATEHYKVDLRDLNCGGCEAQLASVGR